MRNPEVNERVHAAQRLLDGDPVECCQHLQDVIKDLVEDPLASEEVAIALKLGLCALHLEAGLLCRPCWDEHALRTGELVEARPCDLCQAAPANHALNGRLDRLDRPYDIRTPFGDVEMTGEVPLYPWAWACPECFRGAVEWSAQTDAVADALRNASPN